MTDMCHIPYFLYYRSYPIDNSINNRCHCTVNDYGSRYRKHLGTNAENETLCVCTVRTYIFVFC